MMRIALALSSLLALALVAIGAQAPSPTSAPPAAAPQAGKQVVFITGANRGIGLELARQSAAAGYAVIGTARNPAEAKELAALGVRVMQLDVTDAASVKSLAEALKGTAIDILFNNAGVTGGGSTLEAMDIEGARTALDTNVLGPMRVTQALLPNLKAGSRKTIVSISSRLGSIARNESGGYYGYRESKAALNMFMRSIAVELKPAGFTCVAMSPGWVRTDMGGSSATLSPEESVRGILKVVDGLKPEDSGRFFGQDGPQIDW